MTISIASAIFDKWREFGEYLLTDDNFSCDCILNYPPIPITSSSTSSNSLSGNPGNVFQTGQPAPFNFGENPYEGGETFKDNTTTQTIRLRVYFDKRNWIKIGNIALPAGAIQVIGKMADLAKFKSAISVKIFNSKAAVNMTYRLEGEVILHGFGKTFFIANMVQA